jgi:hypothetical protein
MFAAVDRIYLFDCGGRGVAEPDRSTTVSQRKH